MTRPLARSLSAIACGLLLAACGADGGAPGEGSALDGRGELRDDPRIAWLLQPFPRDEHYDVDTSDTLGILVAALLTGHRDPLKAARIQLADEGPAGVEAARRVIERAWNNPDRFNDIRNALDVLAYSRDDSAHLAIGKVLEHPAPVPRQAAWRALRVHPDPRWYDPLKAIFDQEQSELRLELALTLHDMDPARAEELYLSWIAEGRERGLWRDLAQRLAASEIASTHERACGLIEGTPPRLSAMLAAACARGGSSSALERLRTLQRSEDPMERRVAVESLNEADFAGELVWTLERDPDATLRQLACQAISRHADDEGFTQALLDGMSDSSAEVAQLCMRQLLERGHPQAVEQALGELTNPRPGVAEATVLALAQVWGSQPELAERSLETLLVQHEEVSHRELGERRGVVRSIGMVPLAESAAWLDELSEEVEGTVSGMPAARWVVLQIGNAGEPGQRHLLGALEGESDPFRRLDLIEALSANTSELSRDWLLARAASEDVEPYELLYIADRLTRMGPARLVAPVLKRAVLRVEQDDVRRSLQGLLWMWFPEPVDG